MVIADTLAGIRREARVRPSAKKAAIAAADLIKMIAAARGISSKAVRDRAVLALGLASALRRSELVALQLADVQLVSPITRRTISDRLYGVVRAFLWMFIRSFLQR